MTFGIRSETGVRRPFFPTENKFQIHEGLLGRRGLFAPEGLDERSIAKVSRFNDASVAKYVTTYLLGSFRLHCPNPAAVDKDRPFYGVYGPEIHRLTLSVAP